ncbi:MAG: YcxB family protein [Eubacterium sp.]|nr:YcxB family protein [Eubacterium sp.]
MEPLYVTETAYTLEEYSKFNKAIVGNKFHIVSLLLLLCCVLNYLASKNIYSALFFVIMIAMLEIVIPLSQKSAVKKQYYSDRHLLKNYMYQFCFYQSYFEIKTYSAYAKIDYEDIVSVKETKTNFYLMRTINQGHIIAKENCSPELIAFLTNLKNIKG